ncbi:hypothetical protein DPMN_159736 [Dreissena polymorpha]|uniref:Uncharacterized protein n=1 Tax=Dreissena polymorpha TaxID=45954 RepID=A0A9D4EM01_DREPO|nr:hypothetical protein DPMN_159736 [Dreissena polymorpha]
MKMASWMAPEVYSPINSIKDKVIMGWKLAWKSEIMVNSTSADVAMNDMKWVELTNLMDMGATLIKDGTTFQIKSAMATSVMARQSKLWTSN